MDLQVLKVGEGSPIPMGATVEAGGVNFAVFSRNGTAVTLILFNNGKKREIVLDPAQNRTGDVWHCLVEGLGEGAEYLYRVDGPFQPEEGFRFNRNKALVDPYAKALTSLSGWDFARCRAYKRAYQLAVQQNSSSRRGHDDDDLSFSPDDDSDAMPRCVVVDNKAFDWQGDRPLNLPLRHSIIYETHVKGLSAGDSKSKNRGTYRGVVEKIPYLKELGITSLELLPIHEFFEGELTRKDPETGKNLVNYWGYSTVAFFAPKGSYAAGSGPGSGVTEFKEMVRELHKAGIEVILDVVFNHTAEGNELGPTISFKGFDNSIYYILNNNKRYYQNYSGCGNTLNCNNPIVRNLILDSLKYWVVEMHVDGFRFDLGSILGRDQWGNLMENPPTLELIAEEPILRNTKIIAEAWDAGGAYQVGWFPGGRWAEWNDKFRDEVRRFWRGDNFLARNLATRLSGSSDLYLRDGRKPFHSINFVTCHDGFTLRDLVSYEYKHNEANGENNNDGGNNNCSANYGAEGPSDDPAINEVRIRQMKNFFATMLISLGTPMILGGDEMGRTQGGNNNAYCQDNKITWYDWDNFFDKRGHGISAGTSISAETGVSAETFGYERFVRAMIAFRKRHEGFMRPEFYVGRGSYNAKPDISWFNEDCKTPDWDTTDKKLSALIEASKAALDRDRDTCDFFIMFNADTAPASFKLPAAPKGKHWRRAVDTSLKSPDDICEDGKEAALQFPRYKLKERSMAILVSRD